MVGELSLDGNLQPVKGALPIAIKAREEGFEGFILPKENAREAAVVDTLKVYLWRHGKIKFRLYQVKPLDRRIYW